MTEESTRNCILRALEQILKWIIYFSLFPISLFFPSITKKEGEMAQMRQDEIEYLLITRSSRLRELQLRWDREGDNTPPEVITEIRYSEAEIKRLQAKLPNFEEEPLRYRSATEAVTWGIIGAIILGVGFFIWGAKSGGESMAFMALFFGVLLGAMIGAAIGGVISKKSS